MGTIPAPNIVEAAGDIASAPVNALQEYARVAQLKQATAVGQQQEQGLQLENQQKQQAIADQQATTKAFLGWDHKDPNELATSVVKNGGSATAAQAIQQHYLGLRQTAAKIAQDDATTGKTNLDTKIEQHNQTLGQLTALDDVPDEQLSQHLTEQGQKLSASQDPEEQQAGQHVLSFASMPPAQARQQLKIVEHALMGEKEQFTQAQDVQKQQTAQQEANSKDWKDFPALGMAVNTKTGEQRSVTGAGGLMPPGMMEAKYVALQQKQNAGQPLSKEDAAWTKGYEKMKTLVPQFTNVMALTGGGLGPSATPAAAPGTPGAKPAPDPAKVPGGWVSGSGKSLNDVPASIRGEVQQVLEYRRADPSITQRGPVGQAISQWVADLDPQHDGTTFGNRNKTLTEFQKDASSGELGAVNTALGHLGELYTAAQALQGGNLPILHSIAAKFGLATGGDAASTYRAILHRVGPEMTKAYIKGGGTEGERGSNEADFDIDKGQKQIVSNIAESAQLLNSKLASKKQAWETGFQPYRDRDSFENRFLTPDAKKTLGDLSSMAPTNKGGAGGGETKTYQGHTYSKQADGSWKLQS